MHNRRLDRRFWRYHGRNLQHGYHIQLVGLLLVGIAPRIAAFGFYVANEVENLNLAIPNRLALEYLYNGHCLAVRGFAAMQQVYLRL